MRIPGTWKVCQSLGDPSTTCSRSSISSPWGCDDCGMHVRITDDAARVLDEAGPFLRSKPVEHNLVLTLLTERAAHPEPGRFWWVDA